MQRKDETHLLSQKSSRHSKLSWGCGEGDSSEEKLRPCHCWTSIVIEDEAGISLLAAQSIIIEHIEKLIEEFDWYLPDEELHEKYQWVRWSFNVNVTRKVVYPQLARGAHRGATRWNSPLQFSVTVTRRILGCCGKGKPVLGSEAVSAAAIRYNLFVWIISGCYGNGKHKSVAPRTWFEGLTLGTIEPRIKELTIIS